MTHSDDNGLVLPPQVAPFQVVIIPIFIKGNNNEDIDKVAHTLGQALSKLDIRVHVDDSKHVTAGFKYNHWELKGVPLRIEIGPRDLKANSITAVLRHNSTKRTISLNSIETSIPSLLRDIQKELYIIAKQKLDSSVMQVGTQAELVSVLKNGQLALAPFCGEVKCDDTIKKSGIGKSMCIPHQQPQLEPNTPYIIQTRWICIQKC